MLARGRALPIIALLALAGAVVLTSVKDRLVQVQGSDATRRSRSTWAVDELIRQNLSRLASPINQYESVGLTTADPPWKLFHGLLGHGRSYQIMASDGNPRDCIDWLLREASWKPAYRGL